MIIGAFCHFHQFVSYIMMSDCCVMPNEQFVSYIMMRDCCLAQREQFSPIS
jgi:hypothetical protein